MRPNECYAYFGLSGSLDPAAITVALGLKPSKVRLAGEKLRSGKVRVESFWSIEDRIARDARVDFEARVKDVLEQVSPCFEVAAGLARRYHGTIMLVGYFHDYDPGLWLEADTVQRIAALGASVQCDFYHLLEKKPNQAPEPTATAVTPPAAQEPRQP